MYDPHSYVYCHIAHYCDSVTALKFWLDKYQIGDLSSINDINNVNVYNTLLLVC